MEINAEKRCSCGKEHDIEGVDRLATYIWEDLRAYAKETPIDRHVLANALFKVCAYFFIPQSPQNTKGQLEEIENFSTALKEVAIKEDSTMQ